MDWSRIARDTIAKAAESVPEGATAKERRAILNAAYPFGERAYWPYKAWLKAMKEHMAKYERPKSQADLLAKHKSPLERMMEKAANTDAILRSHGIIRQDRAPHA
jgi:hypothetical protein